MPKYNFIDFHISQVGKTLSSNSTIKVNRYDNKISRIVFDLDGTIPEHLRLYCALLNPKTGKYFYDPILTDIDGNHYIVIGTNISYYQGRWNLLIIGTASEYSLSGYEDIDETLIAYVTNVFTKFVVLDNFLSDDSVKVSFPTIDETLDDFIILRDTVVDYAQQTGNDVTLANEALNNCQTVLLQCQDILSQVQELLSRITANYQSYITGLNTTYNQLSSNLRNEYEDYVENLNQLGGG